MSEARARIVRADEAGTARPLLARGAGARTHRRIARQDVEEHLAAERTRVEAEALAAATLGRARLEASAAEQEARARGREEGHAELVARWARLRASEQGQLERDSERVIRLATLLAERLIGAALDLEPALVASLARTVVAEARGARRATIEAHPLDAESLRTHLSEAGLDASTFVIRDEPGLARGALRLHTDLGTIDAQLAPRLERLAAALRDAV